MIVRCPACGAEASLDLLVDHDAAAQALTLALSMAPLGAQIVRYLALFRPALRRLTWPRVAALLGELLPMILSMRIVRDGRAFDAPLAAWASGIDKCIQARDAGTLRPPLKTHGYLLEIVIAEAARSMGAGAAAVVVRDTPERPTPTAKPASAVASAVNSLQQRKRQRTEAA